MNTRRQKEKGLYLLKGITHDGIEEPHQYIYQYKRIAYRRIAEMLITSYSCVILHDINGNGPDERYEKAEDVAKVIALYD